MSAAKAMLGETKMKGLDFFRRCHPGFWNIVSWHSPHSMTWRWILSFSRRHKEEPYVWPILMTHRTNGGLQWTLRIPLVGLLMFTQQKPMWFRDLWQRAAAERDELKYMTRTPSPRPPLRSPFKPTVIDGGQSVH